MIQQRINKKQNEIKPRKRGLREVEDHVIISEVVRWGLAQLENAALCPLSIGSMVSDKVTPTSLKGLDHVFAVWVGLPV